MSLGATSATLVTALQPVEDVVSMAVPRALSHFVQGLISTWSAAATDGIPLNLYVSSSELPNRSGGEQPPISLSEEEQDFAKRQGFRSNATVRIGHVDGRLCVCIDGRTAHLTPADGLLLVRIAVGLLEAEDGYVSCERVRCGDPADPMVAAPDGFDQAVNRLKKAVEPVLAISKHDFIQRLSRPSRIRLSSHRRLFVVEPELATHPDPSLARLARRLLEVD